MKVYLAGPDVFLPEAVALGRLKKEFCADYGFEGLFPLDNELEGGDRSGLAQRIFAANLGLMRQADLGLFNLTPFRGPSADVGTVFELGFMSAMGKPVFGYTATSSSLLTRVIGATTGPDERCFDPNGHSIEDFGNADNLMIDGILSLEGNGLLRNEAGGKLGDVETFKSCLRLAAERLKVSRPAQ